MSQQVERPKAYNDHRADHTVHVLVPMLGTCVTIPYKDHVISLAADGQSVIVFDAGTYEYDMQTDGVYGTSGESILAAMKHIDAKIALLLQKDRNR